MVEAYLDKETVTTAINGCNSCSHPVIASLQNPNLHITDIDKKCSNLPLDKQQQFALELLAPLQGELRKVNNLYLGTSMDQISVGAAINGALHLVSSRGACARIILLENAICGTKNPDLIEQLISQHPKDYPSFSDETNKLVRESYQDFKLTIDNLRATNDGLRLIDKSLTIAKKEEWELAPKLEEIKAILANGACILSVKTRWLLQIAENGNGIKKFNGYNHPSLASVRALCRT